jgi:hypothetical protein
MTPQTEKKKLIYQSKRSGHGEESGADSYARKLNARETHRERQRGRKREVRCGVFVVHSKIVQTGKITKERD